jgi:hypothetical protein
MLLVTILENLAIMWVSAPDSKGASFELRLDITWIVA